MRSANQAGPRRVATGMLAGLAGSVVVNLAVVLLSTFAHRGASFGFLVQFILSLVLLVAISVGGIIPLRILGYGWVVRILSPLGSHIMAMMLVLLVAIYTDFHDPYALVLVLAAGLTFLMPVIQRDSPDAETTWLICLAIVSLALFAWFVPAPRPVTVALAWTLLPVPDALRQIERMH